MNWRAVAVGLVIVSAFTVSCSAALDDPPVPQPSCDPPASAIQASQVGFAEAKGSGGESAAWALFVGSPAVEVGREVKVVWRMGGAGDFAVVAKGPGGEIVPATWGPTPHSGSNWDRPGSEWGTSFALPRAGCWTLEARRESAVSTIRLPVSN